MNTSLKYTFYLIFICSVVNFSAIAEEDVNKKKSTIAIQKIAADCNPSEAQTDLAINNVRFRVLAGGDMWWNPSSRIPQYEIPKVTSSNEVRRHSIYAGALWIGGVDGSGQLKVAAQTYRQNGDDFWPGPLDLNTVDILPERCSYYDKHWKINKQDVVDLVNTGNTNVNDILTYPGNGSQLYNEDLSLAPFYDKNVDGLYDVNDGDYPYFNLSGDFPGNECNDFLFGDEVLWWVFNDKGNIHTSSSGQQLGLEIRAQAFAFATNDEINNMTFYKYQIINRANISLNDTYFGQWVDPDLGNAVDDFVGCDVGRGLGFCYNGDVDDDGPGGYGVNPPAVGTDFFQGPLADTLDGIDNDKDGMIDEPGEQIIMSKFLYYENVNGSVNGNPLLANDFYNYLQGLWIDGSQMTWGGNGIGGSVPTCYMFPGDTDPDFQGLDWTEVTAGNVPSDRRYLQSAGKFTLQPGAVNYITVGAVWARASAGGLLASVNLLKIADDKAQSLFDNCFKVLDGPDAPDVEIRELDKEIIISLLNTETKKIELYNEIDPTISAVVQPDPNKRRYYFQGYQIFQLKDATATTSDIGNVDRIRLVAQVDIKDTISQIINFDYNPDVSAYVPKEMVNGSNEGIKHSFKITQDAFASGDPRLVNHRTYYYTVVSYSYNNYKTFDPGLPFDANNTQGKVYLAGRNNIKTYSAIPHISTPELGGVLLNSNYGDGPEIKRIEGQGNGGMNLDLSAESLNEIMENPFHRSLNPVYVANGGPLNLSIYDPLNIEEATYELKFSGVIDSSTWTIKNLNTLIIKNSERNLGTSYEQIIPDWGLSAQIETIDAAGEGAIGKGGGIIDATMKFNESNKPWLSGLSDKDGAGEEDWILAGNDNSDKTPDSEWENLLGGTWSPYKLASSSNYGPKWSKVAPAQLLFRYVNSVDVYLTADKTKWTRSPIVEMGPVSALNEPNGSGPDKGSIRKSLSVDKDGNYAVLGSGVSNNPDDANYISETGMGWFPGYAINVETGERLNMAFGENSSLGASNGKDMLWNPTSEVMGPIDPIFGGGHYIFIFDRNGYDVVKDVPLYDAGAFIVKNLENSTTISEKRNVWKDCIWTSIPLLRMGQNLLDTDVKIRLRVAKNYEKYISREQLLTSSDPLELLTEYYVVKGTVTHNATTYNEGEIFTASSNSMSGNGSVTTPPPVNEFNPFYSFDTRSLAPVTNNVETAKSALDIINVVPNPYYAFSGYEKSSLDNRIKITNLPAKSSISIYNLNGTLIRRIQRDLNQADQTAGTVNTAVNLDTSVDWDLNNENNIPIASGMYIIHIDAGNLGEKTIKWFGVMRPVDLVNF